jgi:hypothetical protein
MLEEDEDVMDFISKYEQIEPVKPRDAFYGGRTESFTLHLEAKDDEKGKYIDVTSLYPFCQAKCRYPTGHPIRIENFKPIEEYFGIIKVKILPPRNFTRPFNRTISFMRYLFQKKTKKLRSL